ncbi:hypothetical protein LuPra_01594 [Luteitalea pratensis]|uniref:Uncharacterized protein n=1 Tax=Luteitalea pratensis TaxID=1855912 RepID=A0A143PKT2_LUTPR|nr:hypothetical protein LuPra_01594 [Luteitalea pratensis]
MSKVAERRIAGDKTAARCRPTLHVGVPPGTLNAASDCRSEAAELSRECLGDQARQPCVTGAAVRAGLQMSPHTVQRQ